MFLYSFVAGPDSNRAWYHPGIYVRNLHLMVLDLPVYSWCWFKSWMADIWYH